MSPPSLLTFHGVTSLYDTLQWRAHRERQRGGGGVNSVARPIKRRLVKKRNTPDLTGVYLMAALASRPRPL